MPLRPVESDLDDAVPALDLQLFAHDQGAYGVPHASDPPSHLTRGRTYPRTIATEVPAASTTTQGRV
ncbi:hypothetical protein NPS01_32730 [Nocardioides psychrotolerans]|nr:hypothetical protein NPS01_32730 [Nocardioides psychrotolerans]